MDGMWIREKVSPEQYRKLKKAEFIDLIITTDNCSDKIRLYPIKTIREYDL